MEKCFFSIIVPVYNVENYLDECIQSVLCQTFTEFELILINDGSTDSSGSICDSYKNDQRVRIIHKNNRGLSHTRNVGINSAVGQYLIFLDSDDFWNKEYFLEELYQEIIDNPPDVIVFNYSKLINNSKTASQLPHVSANKYNNISFDEMSQNNIWIASAWNKVISKSLFETHDLYFIEGITSEDIDWCARLALAATTFSYLDDTVLIYRQRNDSISNTISLNKTTTLKENIIRATSIVENSDKENAKYLMPYLAYQMGTFVYCVAALNNKCDRIHFIPDIKKLKYLLNHAESKKIKLINNCINILGIRITLYLLKLKSKF